MSWGQRREFNQYRSVIKNVLRKEHLESDDFMTGYNEFENLVLFTEDVLEDRKWELQP